MGDKMPVPDQVASPAELATGAVKNMRTYSQAEDDLGASDQFTSNLAQRAVKSIPPTYLSPGKIEFSADEEKAMRAGSRAGYPSDNATDEQ
jgi:hypothetical protein